MNKIFPLQSLRGICVILVMLVHFNPYNGFFLQIHIVASAAVFVFLVLSGFIISMVYEDKITNMSNLTKFYKKRFLRMYPMHALFLFIFLGLEFLKLYFENTYQIVSNNPAFQVNNLYYFFSNLFLLNIFNNSLSYNLPAWTVSGEFLASIFYGLSCIILRKKYLRSLFFVFILFSTIFLFFFYEKNFINYTTTFALFSVIYCFITGYFFFEIFNSKGHIYNFFTKNFIQLLNLILVFIFLKFENLNFFFPFSCGVIIIYLCNLSETNFSGKFWYNKFLIFTGKISYTLYISHFFVYWFYTQLFRHVLKIENINSFENTNFIDGHLTIYILKIILSFSSSYFLSYYLYNKFEKKFI